MALPNLTDEFVADSFFGVLHTSNVPVSGANLPPVYDGLGNKTSLILGSNGNGASITGTLSADGLTLKGFTSIIDYIYPIGSVLFTNTSTNPSVRFTDTTWEQTAEGRFIVGVGVGNDGIESKIFGTGNTEGTYSHTLSVTEIPPHTHSITARPDQSSVDFDNSVQGGSNGDWTATTTSTGGGQPHQNTPPGFGMYIWQRTS
jgi:hypothetical protein